MPTGNRISKAAWGTFQPIAAAAAATFAAKNPKYLKKPSIPKLVTMLSHSHAFRCSGRSVMRRADQ